MAFSPDTRPPERYRDSVERSAWDAFHLPALGTSVAEARRRVLARLADWGIEALARDNAELVISELVTNAVRHTESDKVACELRMAGGRLRLEVTDEGAGCSEPREHHPEADGESGRGLLLVNAVCETWGVERGTGGRGHTVWAELASERPTS